MTDTIFITGVVIHARHGVMEHETEVGQRFVIDLELAADLSESSHTDRLADTVSYSNVVATATAAFKNTNYKLLESLCLMPQGARWDIRWTISRPKRFSRFSSSKAECRSNTPDSERNCGLARNLARTTTCTCPTRFGTSLLTRI